MELKEAYQMVFDDLHNCPMFQGKYDTVSDKCLRQKVSKNKDIEMLKQFVCEYMDEKITKQAKDFPGDIYWYNKQGAIDACNVFLMRLNQYE